MAKRNPLQKVIELDDDDVEAVEEFVKREAPHVKKGFRSIESDVGKTLKALYDYAAGPEYANEPPKLKT